MRLVIRLVVAIALVLLSASSWAQLRYFTLIDSDNNVATGCTVSLSTAGAVAGIDRRLTATVSETATPQVTQLTLESCVGGSFGAPVSLPGTPYPVGLNNGVNGADVVEQAAPINAIAAAGATVRFYFAAQGPTSSDLLGSVNDPPIVIETPPAGPNPVGIPSLSDGGLLILVLLLFVVLIRQRSRFPTSTVSVLLLVGALVGIAWAAGFRLDGQVDDWQGVSAAGTDAVGDSSPKTDITQAFVAQEGGMLFSRLDIANIEGSSPPNRPPVFTSTPVTTANIASPYSYVITTSDPDSNVLTLTAPTKPAWLTFTPGGNGTGTLSGTPGITHFGAHAVVLRVIDSGAPSLSTDQSFTITVNGAIHPEPVIDLNGAAAGLDFAATFTENGNAVAIVDPASLTVVDPDSLNLTSATITLTNLLDTGQEILAASAATIAPNTPLAAAYNAATGVLTLTGSATLAQYQAALRTITYNNTAAALTVTPARAITFVVSDGSNTSAPATATVTLISVNDAPSFTAANPPAVNEDSGAQTVNGWVTAFDPGPADEATQTVLAYAVSNVSNAALFATPPTVDTSGVLHYTPAPNAFGTSTFEVRVQDNGGTANGGVDTSAAQTFTITVNPVNDAPSFTASNPPAANEDAGAQTVNGWATFNPGNPQESAQTVLAYTVSNVSNAALFATPPAVNTSGALSYTSAPNAFGTSTFEVRVKDDGGTANGGVDTSGPQTFTINVTAVDDPPTAVNDSATVAEDDPATAIDVLTNDTDPDGGPKSIVSVTQPTNGTVAITNGGANLTYQPNADYCNAPPGSALDTFGYTLTPGGSSATVTVTVTCVNDAPVVDLNGPAAGIDFAATFTEGGGAVAIVDPANLTVSDVDNPTLASATVTISNLLDTGVETLAAAVAGTSITANYVAPTLALTGPDSLANFQQVLRGVTYNNGSSNPNATARVIQFVANDGASNSLAATSTVTVISINSAPSFTKGADQTVNEDSGARTVNGWATAISDGDGNTGGQILTFQVTNNTNPTLFSAGPAISATGVLTYTPAADANGSATITVTLSDDGSNTPPNVNTSASQTFVINVNPVNDAPSFTKGADQTVLEDAGAQTVNPWATGISAGPANEAGQTLTFNITGNTNPGLFGAGPAISSAGVLTYTPAANANGSATITVALKDDGGTANGGVDTSGPQTFTINVTAVDDPPTAVNDSATVAEDDPATAIDVLTNDTDPDGGPKSIVSVTQPTNGTVAITNGGANLTYQPNADYCNAPPGSALDTFGYTLTPGGSSATVTVTVTCVNDAPVVDLNGPAAGIDFAATFTEGGGAVAIVDPANLTVSDVDNPTLASATVTISNLLDTGVETLAAAVAGTSITANYVAPTLALTGPDSLANFQQVLRGVTYNNGSSNPNATARVIQFVANDGASNSLAATSTVTVISINSAPSFTKGADQTVNEDSGARTVNGWATAISDGDGNTGGQILTFQVTNNTNPTLFSAGPAISATGVLTYTPAADANGSATITVTLSDDGSNTPPNVNTSASQTFVINVNPVNDAPSFTKGADQTVLEDAGAQTVNPWATGISAGPANEAGQTLTFNITGNTNPGLFGAGPAISSAGVLTYTPAANANGSATITVALKDDGGTTNGGVDTSGPQTFVINVAAVNDAPSFTKGADQTVLEDAGAQTVNPWATGISAGPANEAGQTLTFNITGNTNPGLFGAGPAISSAGVLTYTPAANANGSATITVALKDDGGTANGGVDTSASQSFVITVSPVNDPPVAQNKTGFSAQANMKVAGINAGLLTGVTDADSGINGCTPTFSVASINSGTNGTVSAVNLAAGTFDFEPTPGFTGTATATYTVSDDGCPGTATSSAATISINVVGPVIWFVNGAAAAGGDGTLAKPFQTVAAADAVDVANQRIFVFSGTYTNGITLNSDEWLIGQGVSGASFDAVFGITPPTGTIARPAIAGARPTLQNTVTLGTNSQVKGLNVASTTNTGITASGKTGLVTGEVSVTTTTGTAANFSSSGGTLSFTSISANGAANGIALNTTTGSFTVTGDGANPGSGGTIRNTSGADGATTGNGIYLSSANNVSLSWMQLNDHPNFAIRGVTVDGFTMDHTVVSGTNGTNGAIDEASVAFDGLTGSATISNSSISGGVEDNFRVRNSSGTLNRITFTADTFGPNNSTTGNDGLNLEPSGSAVINATIQNSFFTSAAGDLFQFNHIGTAACDLVFTGNTLSNNHPAIATGGGGVTIGGGDNGGSLTYNISGNSFRDAVGHEILIVKSIGSGSYTGTFDNNTIGATGVANSGSLEGSGLKIQNAASGTVTVATTNNTIRQYNNDGILLQAGAGVAASGNFNNTVTGNTVGPLGTNTSAAQGVGIRVTSGVVSGDSFQVCGRINGNTLTGSGISGSDSDYRLRQRFNTTVRLPSYGGAAGDTAAVVNFVDGNNTVTLPLPAGTATAAFPATGGGFIGTGTTCP